MLEASTRLPVWFKNTSSTIHSFHLIKHFVVSTIYYVLMSLNNIISHALELKIINSSCTIIIHLQNRPTSIQSCKEKIYELILLAIQLANSTRDY